MKRVSLVKIGIAMIGLFVLIFILSGCEVENDVVTFQKSMQSVLNQRVDLNKGYVDRLEKAGFLTAEDAKGIRDELEKKGKELGELSFQDGDSVNKTNLQMITSATYKYWNDVSEFNNFPGAKVNVGGNNYKEPQWITGKIRDSNGNLIDGDGAIWNKYTYHDIRDKDNKVTDEAFNKYKDLSLIHI